jgi:hypothetical protein
MQFYDIFSCILLISNIYLLRINKEQHGYIFRQLSGYLQATEVHKIKLQLQVHFVSVDCNISSGVL